MIRRAEKRDIPDLDRLLYQVHALHAEGRPDIFVPGQKKYTDEELAALLPDDSRPVYVYEENGAVLGYVFCMYEITSAEPSRLARKVIYIDDLCVDAAARRAGVGKKLYDFVMDRARAEGCDAVTLHVWDVNPGARAFYESMGMGVLKTLMEQRLK